MERRYRIVVSPGCERDLKRAITHQAARYAALLAARDLLATDPYNRQRQAHIRKLEDVPPGEGQFRLRVGDYRLRYDIVEDVVILYSFLPRRDSYR